MTLGSPARPAAVQVRGFSWTHVGRKQPACADIDLDIAPGERVLICGDSGSGKSTLLAALGGVLGGRDEGEQTGSVQVTGLAGMVLQDPDAQVIYSRVGDDVAFGCENVGYPREEIWQRVAAAVELVGLQVPLDFPTQQLSGGQKQRLALAGVMAMGAGLILLDEPTANLDPNGAREVVAAVARVVQETGATLVVVEHNYELWEGVLDRAICMEHGCIGADGPVAEVVARRQYPELPVATPVPAAASAAVSPAVQQVAAAWSRDLRCRGTVTPRTAALPEGYSTVITGANGAGKTTWLLTMAGLLPVRGGEIGYSAAVREGLRGAPAQWKSRELARRIGMVFQNPEHQFVARTVREELQIGTSAPGAAAHAQELLERLRLEQVADANPFTLSGGEKRRLSVATALLARPRMVLLDEPTFGQDPTTFAELVWLLRGLVEEGVTIAAVTHDPLYLAALGDHHVHFGGSDE